MDDGRVYIQCDSYVHNLDVQKSFLGLSEVYLLIQAFCIAISDGGVISQQYICHLSTCAWQAAPHQHVVQAKHSQDLRTTTKSYDRPTRTRLRTERMACRGWRLHSSGFGRCVCGPELRSGACLVFRLWDGSGGCESYEHQCPNTRRM